MDGVFSSRPTALSDAIDSIRNECASLNWAVQLQSGPFRDIHLTEEDDSRNLLHLFHDFSAGEPAWFKPGILPGHARQLVQDEWSFYLGFSMDAKELCGWLDDDLSPRPHLFEVVETIPCIYLLFVDDGWWEGYATDVNILTKLKSSWRGQGIDSCRWEDGVSTDPTCSH